MSSVERMPTSVEVGAVVVETSAPKSAASKEWHETLSHDAERARHALDRSATFKAEQRMYHDKHGEGTVVGPIGSPWQPRPERQVRGDHRLRR